MKLLPYQDESFSDFRDKSVQDFRFALSEGIRQQVFFATLVQNIETQIKSSFDTIKKKHWSPTTVAAIVRDEIYIGTRIWGKTRCSMHTGYKAVLNDETEWVRLENHHTAIIDRALFEKANEMHSKKKRSVAESRTNFTLERRKKQPALLLCANCGYSLLKEIEHLLKCSDARTNGDPVCRSLAIRREPLEENILGLVHQYVASMLEKEKKVSSNRQCDDKEINTAELQKQSRQLT